MPKHIVRLLVLLLGFLVLAYAGIVFLTDPSFYRFGHFRADVVPELAAGTPKFRGSDYCSACHVDRHAQWSGGPHVKVNCEACHGLAGDHPASGKLPVARDPVKLCTNCHEAMPARPDSQPQIVVAEHPYPHQDPIACITCHNPHAPRIGAPETVVQPLADLAETKEEVTETPAGDEPRGTVGTPLSASGCAGCHGQQGEGTGAFPAIAGMDAVQFVKLMNQYKTGEIPSPMMAAIAQALSDDEVRELANYYAAMGSGSQ